MSPTFRIEHSFPPEGISLGDEEDRFVRPNFVTLLFRDGKVEKLKSAANTVVGQCKISETTMQKDDVLLLYTDGVVEAFDGAGQEFGDLRLSGPLSPKRRSFAHELLPK